METIHHDVESHDEIEYGNMHQHTGTCQLHGTNISKSKMTNTKTNLEMNDTLSIVSDACKKATTNEFIVESTHEPSCAICLDPFQMGDMVSYSSDVSLCHHEYHQICITEWLMKCYQCPVCRSNYIPIPTHFLPSPSPVPSAAAPSLPPST
jgi:Ring finger domain